MFLKLFFKIHFKLNVHKIDNDDEFRGKNDFWKQNRFDWNIINIILYNLIINILTYYKINMDKKNPVLSCI